jgi:C-terminal processing protease CtpA/Prc
MGRAPHITRIGENTQGVFSDVLARQLPNGWRFWLPNEVYRTPEGTTFDGAGIPPDVAVPVFADEDVAAGRDPAMAKALQLLGVGQRRLSRPKESGETETVTEIRQDWISRPIIPMRIVTKL